MRDEVRLLGLVIDATSADMDVADVVQRVANLVTEATGSDVCFVHLLDEERQCVVLAGATPPFDQQIGKVELRLGQGIAGWVALHAEAAVVPDKWQDERYRYIPALRGEDYASMVSVPMLIPRGRRVIGVLNVHSKEARDYGSYDLALLTQVANLMARAIENARLYQRLAEREEMLEGFATRTIEAQEHERRRLAGEIHDGISQRLISLWYHLLAAEDGANGADLEVVGRELGVAKELVTAALEDARGAIVGLRPTTLDDLGLGASLESLARSLPVKEVSVELEAVDPAAPRGGGPLPHRPGGVPERGQARRRDPGRAAPPPRRRGRAPGGGRRRPGLRRGVGRRRGVPPLLRPPRHPGTGRAHRRQGHRGLPPEARHHRRGHPPPPGGRVSVTIFEPLLAALTSSGTRFVVVGGVAVVLHGHPRFTADLDVALDLTADEPRRVVEALTAVGLVPLLPVDAR